jgi:rubrerythrin
MIDKEFNMLEIHKKIVVDENMKPIAVQIPIDEFERMEEVIENYGLAKLMEEIADDEQLSVQEAKKFYGSLKQNVES